MSRPRTSNKFLPKYVTIQGASYWYRPPDSEKPIRIATVGDERTLYRYLADAMPVAGPITTLGDCLDRYQREVVPSLKSRTQRDYARHLKHLKHAFGHMAPKDLQPRDIGKFLAVEKGKIHRNKLVSVLSAVYSKAIGKWFVDGVTVNPCSNVERNPSKKRDRYITDKEFAMVRGVMPPRVQIAMDLAYLTTQRQGDLLGLKWKEVSEAGIHFQQGKTGKKVFVEMSPMLHEVMVRAKFMVPQLPREYVLRTRKGKPYTSEGFRAIWQRKMKHLCRTGALPIRFTFHDIRAKSVSDSASLEDAMKRAGHQNMSMTRGVYDRGIRKVPSLK